MYYSEKSFRILTETITLLLSSYGKDSESIAKGLLSIDSTLHEFFLKEGLFSVWGKINKESKKKNIDPKITKMIWKAMIRSFINYEFRNFNKK